MPRVGQYTFKRAESAAEIEQIHRLNYRTFVEEIPQHAADPNGRLVDKFHAKNTYFVAVRAQRVVGMISAHGEPPFSVADRLPDPGLITRGDRRPIEVRLLAIEPQERHGAVLIGLLWMALEHARTAGASDVFISAFADRVAMYQRIGFQPLGPAVPSGKAEFVPMRVSFPLAEEVRQLIDAWNRRLDRLTRGEMV